jgi:hypothetical protein
MRMVLKINVPVEKGNHAFTHGSLGKTMEALMNRLKPEAAYFCPMNGKRSGMMFLDLTEPSQIIEVVEPLFMKLNAEVESLP